MAASKRWALVVGLSLVLLALVALTLLMRHPVDLARSDLTRSDLTQGAVAPPKASAPPQPAANQPVTNQQAVSQPAIAPGPSSEPPHFDIVRVEPTGDTVVAGRGAPNAKVALIAEGTVIAETTTDGNGHFVVLPPSLAPGDHALSLRQTPLNGTASTSIQSVTVSVPARGKGSVVVALAEPGQATKVLSAPDAPVSPRGANPEAGKTPEAIKIPEVAVIPSAPPASPSVHPASETPVAVRAVDLENGDGFHASGVAKPGTPLRLYLNNAHIADVVADQAGQWTVTIKKGLAGGHYVVRADAGVPTEAPRKAATVTARAEVPFDVPTSTVATSPAGQKSVSTATTPIASTSASPPDAGNPANRRQPTIADAGNAVIEEIQTARVINGDSLWAISLTRLGQAQRYTQIYAANEKQIRDPNLIYPGQVFVLPR